MKKLFAALLASVLLLYSMGAAAEYISANSHGTENLPEAVQAYIDGSRWKGWEVTGWVNPNGLKTKGACAFAVVKNGKQNVLLAFGWGDKGWSYKWYNPAALPQVDEIVDLVDSNTNLQISEGFDVGFLSSYTVNNESSEKQCIWVLKEDGTWNLHRLNSISPFMFFDTSKDNAMRLYDVGWVDGPETDVWVYGVYQKNLRYFNLANFPMSVEQARKDLSNPPQIPSGTLTARKIQFTGGKKYKVYQGPGEEYGQAGKGKAVVSTNDWIQVFGRENDWIMIQYDISSDHMRIGWIKAEALPKNADVPELYFAPIYAAPVSDVSLTDDPLFSQTSVMTIPKGTQIYWLARMGDWAYVELPGSQPVRGFLKLDHMLDYGVYMSNGASAEEELHVFRMSLPFDPNSWSVEERAAEGDKILELMVKYPGFNENRGYTVYGLPKDGEVSYDRALAFAKEALQAKYGSDGAWHINDYPVTRAAFTRIPYWGDKMPAPNWMFIFGDEVFYQIYITADPSGPSLIVIHDMDNANG